MCDPDFFAYCTSLTVEQLQNVIAKERYHGRQDDASDAERALNLRGVVFDGRIHDVEANRRERLLVGYGLYGC